MSYRRIPTTVLTSNGHESDTFRLQIPLSCASRKSSSDRRGLSWRSVSTIPSIVGGLFVDVFTDSPAPFAVCPVAVRPHRTSRHARPRSTTRRPHNDGFKRIFGAETARVILSKSSLRTTTLARKTCAAVDKTQLIT